MSAKTMNGVYTRPNYMMPSGIQWTFPITPLANGWGVSVATVEPSMAEAMLKTNHDDNRNKRKTVLGRYISDMAEGRWKLTHEGIAFDIYGRLSDGQHRCEACIKSQKPFQTLVFFGVGGDEEMSVFNTGASRSHTDAAAVIGINVTSNEMATLRAFMMGPIADGNVPVYTTSQMLAWANKYKSAMEFMRSITTKSHGVKKILSSAVRGAIMRAFYHAEPARLLRYSDVLRDSISPSEPGDRSAVTLRHALINQSASGNVNRREIYCKTQRSIQAYLNGEDISRIYGCSDDLYPLPTDEQLAARA